MLSLTLYILYCVAIILVLASIQFWSYHIDYCMRKIVSFIYHLYHTMIRKRYYIVMIWVLARYIVLLRYAKS